MLGLIIPAFIAGILTFLAPCTLPLVPGYLVLISGASLSDLKDSGKEVQARRKIFLNSVFYVLGFSAVFIFFGTVSSSLGQLLGPYHIWLTRIGGILVVASGLFMLGIFRAPVFSYAFQINASKLLGGGRPRNSFLLGVAFAFGWTPCVGPILGSILFLASTSQTAAQGAFLLGVFSFGLAIPFLAIALGIGSAAKYMPKISGYLNAVSVVGGLFLVLVGILLFLGKTSILISYGYRMFDFINYNRLLDYL